MDNLTHTLTAVLLSRAGLARYTPRATWICVLGANIADVDLAAATSTLNYLNYHRHFTHSLPAVPVMAALTIACLELPRRWRRPDQPPLPLARAWGVACIAALSHVLLDMTNPYGIRLWLPFSEGWHSWDILFILDPWVWVILLVATLGPMLTGMVRREIGAESTPGKGMAWVGLLAFAVFLGGKAMLHDRAVKMLDARLYDNTPALRVAAFPTPFHFSPFAWTGFVETASQYHTPQIDLWDQPNELELGCRYYKPRSSPALDAALTKSDVGRDFARFAQYLYAEVDEVPEGYRTRLTDFRFRRPTGARFVCTIEMDRELQILEEQVRF